MFQKKTLFIGCGDGREILPLVNNRKHLLIGLEPTEQMYKQAVEALKGFSNVRIIKQRIQDWKCVEHKGTIDQIYFIFPPPRLLQYQAEEIIAKVYSLLSGEGQFNVYTEVTLSGWPDPVDMAGLQDFLRVLRKESFSVSVKEIAFDKLPQMAKESNCGILFKTHNLTRFTNIEAKKIGKRS